ncbi:MAG: ABC transporter ATP-binding protein [Sphaerochaetaceae bacterium]|nr:ABC transporter ATP-binding protein [Sphaerochaetaceae bacterium]
MHNDVILEVNELKTIFQTHSGRIAAVDNVSFKLQRNETLGIVGESGCGKSVTARSILKLVEFEGGSIESGRIDYWPTADEKIELALLDHRSKQMQNIRGAQISMIFQEPMASFNPVYSIGKQLAEIVIRHKRVSKREARDQVIELLSKVKIPNALHRFDDYPHEFSGGMRQRAMIVMAILCNPRILIADEPTTALDVTVEAQILDLIHSLKVENRMSTIIITHDMSVVGEMTDHVMVMYAGRVVEYADTEALFAKPLHPYTKALLQSIPMIGKGGELFSIEGSVPSLLHLPSGCYFAPRCPYASDRCKRTNPPEILIDGKHLVHCWLYAEDRA